MSRPPTTLPCFDDLMRSISRSPSASPAPLSQAHEADLSSPMIRQTPGVGIGWQHHHHRPSPSFTLPPARPALAVLPTAEAPRRPGRPRAATAPSALHSPTAHMQDFAHTRAVRSNSHSHSHSHTCESGEHYGDRVREIMDEQHVSALRGKWDAVAPYQLPYAAQHPRCPTRQPSALSLPCRLPASPSPSPPSDATFQTQNQGIGLGFTCGPSASPFVRPQHTGSSYTDSLRTPSHSPVKHYYEVESPRTAKQAHYALVHHHSQPLGRSVSREERRPSPTTWRYPYGHGRSSVSSLDSEQDRAAGGMRIPTVPRVA